MSFEEKDLDRCMNLLTDLQTSSFYINPVVLAEDEKDAYGKPITSKCTREAKPEEKIILINGQGI